MRRLLLLLLCVVPVAADWDTELKRFKEAYRRDAATEARQQAILGLGRADRAPAAELLFKVWNDLARDAAGLRRELNEIRSKIRELSAKLDKTRDDESRRASIRRLVADLNEQDARENARLAGAELEQAAVLDALRAMRSEDALAWMAETGLDRAKDPLLLHTVALRVATARTTGVQTLVIALDRVKKPEQIVPLLQALGGKGAEIGPGFATLLKHLQHESWEARVAAAHAIAAVALPDGVGPLVRAFEAENATPRAQREMARALTKLTGADYGLDRELWARWWHDHGKQVENGEIELGKGKPVRNDKADQGHFYGIPQDFERAIYVLDISGSMQVSMENPRWYKGEAVPARDNEESRFEAAKRELLNAIKRLHRKSHYAVVLYSDHATALHEELVPATPENHAKLATELERRGAEGSTNIYEALDFALRMANVHPEQTRGDERADVIFLVSDGAPTNSRGKSEDPERTLQAVRQWNAMKRIAIHTIGIGADHSRTFMQALADENGGRYYAVVPKKR